MKKRLGALCAVILAFALLVCGASAFLPSYASLAQKAPFIPYTTYDQLKSFKCMRSQYDARVKAGDNPCIILASSELKPVGKYGHPTFLFTNANYGMNTMNVGRGFVTSLWDAVEAGAFAKDGIKGNKLVVCPSMQWFFGNTRKAKRDINAVFSQDAYDTFMTNSAISESTKSRITKKLRKYGVFDNAQGKKTQGTVSNIENSVSSAALSWQKDVSLRTSLSLNSTSGENGLDLRLDGSSPQTFPATRFSTLETPNWKALQRQAKSYTDSQCTNDLGMSDEFYQRKYKKWTKIASRWKKGRKMKLSKDELHSLGLLLDVCAECNIEVMVVIEPVNGRAWDKTLFTQERRESYYSAIMNVCRERGVRVSDWASHEYDKSFMRDYTHPSDYGWSLICEDIYNFYMNK